MNKDIQCYIRKWEQDIARISSYRITPPNRLCSIKPMEEGALVAQFEDRIVAMPVSCKLAQTTGMKKGSN